MTDMVVGKTIVMPCMRRGLVKYPDETVLVSQKALEQLSETAYGIPVTIDHPHRKIDSESLPEIQVVGRVSKMFFKPEDDLWYAEFVVDKEDGVKLLQDGWGVSTAWYGHEYTQGGSYNALEYDRELVSGRYEHLAIVKNPRYEMATDPIFLNSKTSKPCTSIPKGNSITLKSISNPGGVKMFAKIWRTTREEVKANENEELVLELEHGQVPLSKILEELKEYKPEKKEASMRALNDDEEVEVNGNMMKVSELKKHYQEYMESKKNKDEAKCAEDEKKAAMMHEEEAKEHEEEEKEEKEEKEEYEGKKNSKEDSKARFNSLKSAYESGHNIKIEDQFVSTRERVEMGKSRYGSSK